MVRTSGHSPIIACLLCKKERTGILISPVMRDAKAAVVRCATCGLVQMERIPTKKELAAFYNKGKQAANVKVSLDMKNLWGRQKDDTLRRMGLAQTLIRKNARVLDIGSGYGFFLREMRARGYAIEGIEISELSRNISKKTAPKSPVHAVDLDSPETDLGDLGKFDLITLFHVVEHFPNPIGTMQRIKKLLAPGGKILIEVPNIDDAMLETSPAYKSFYWQYAHCAYYSAQTMSKMLKRAGLKKSTLSFTQRYGIENMLQWVVYGKPQIEGPSYATKKPELRELEKHYKNGRVKNDRADTLLSVVRT